MKYIFRISNINIVRRNGKATGRFVTLRITLALHLGFWRGADPLWEYLPSRDGNSARKPSTSLKVGWNSNGKTPWRFHTPWLLLLRRHVLRRQFGVFFSFYINLEVTFDTFFCGIFFNRTALSFALLTILLLIDNNQDLEPSMSRGEPVIIYSGILFNLAKSSETTIWRKSEVCREEIIRLIQSIFFSHINLAEKLCHAVLINFTFFLRTYSFERRSDIAYVSILHGRKSLAAASNNNLLSPTWMFCFVNETFLVGKTKISQWACFLQLLRPKRSRVPLNILEFFSWLFSSLSIERQTESGLW